MSNMLQEIQGKLELRPVTRTNWEQCAKIELLEEQRNFVPSPLRCIAESQFYPDSKLEAVYFEGNIVGIVTYGKPVGDSIGKIFRLIIDCRWQKRGLGRFAMRHVLEALSDFNKIEICYHPQNSSARNLYRDLGFKELRVEESAPNGTKKVVAILDRSTK